MSSSSAKRAAPLPQPANSRPPRVRPYVIFLAAFTAVVFLTHLRYFDLPYYWDELGQFVPAALDLHQRGAWVPQRTIPNIHPPGLMAYLAAVWTFTGASVAATRGAMLALASCAVLIVFLLAIELTKGIRGAPALLAVVLLLASPLFYTQAMLAQLDLPAMLFTCWALLLFLQDRRRAAALACTALVLMKETGLVVPFVLGAWTWFEGRTPEDRGRLRREALWFFLPLLPLAGWLLVLWRSTGHLMGNSEFTEYNLFFPLHPVRLGAALARRAFHIGLENFHWVGWLAVAAAWRRKIFHTRAWRVAGVLAAAQVLAVTALGGAVLERYLLPAMPVFFIAFAAAFSALRGMAARAGFVLLAGGMVFSLFWIPPYQYPFENNLAMVDFVRLQQTAAEYVTREHPGRTITTAWPLTAALWLPELGYVSRRTPIRNLPDFQASRVRKLERGAVDVFVLFSREWEREHDLRHVAFAKKILRKLYYWEPQITGPELMQRLGLVEEARWDRGQQWVAVYVKRPGR